MYRQAIGRMKRWLLQENEEPRRAPRNSEPEVIVYYWDGSAPEGHRLRDISPSGAYILTPERWYPGTIIRIILQRYQAAREDGAAVPAVSTCISARVVRHGSDGVAVEFTFRDTADEESLRAFLAAIPPRPERMGAGKEVGKVPGKVPLHVEGQALVEFALIVPLVLLLAVNAANFGGFIFAWITVANAARDGAQYMVMSSASPGNPTAATLTQITTLVSNDVLSLLNRSSVGPV